MLSGISVNPNVPPTFIESFSQILLFSSPSQLFAPEISCLPIPEAVKPSNPLFPQTIIAFEQSFCENIFEEKTSIRAKKGILKFVIIVYCILIVL